MATSPEVAASLSCEISHQILDSKLLKIHLLVAFCMQQYWNLLHTAVLESFAYSSTGIFCIQQCWNLLLSVVPALSKDYNQECHLRLTK